YGKAFRQPSPYYRYNTFIAQGDNFLTEQNINITLLPEITNSFEVGSSWHNETEDVRLEATYFYSQTNNLISFDQIVIDPDDPSNRLLGVGYFNFGETYAKLQGLQLSAYLKNLIPGFYFQNRLHVQYAWGEEELPGIGVLDQVRAQPAWTFQWLQEAKISQNIYLHLHHLVHSSSISRRANSLLEVRQDPEQYDIPGYYNLDAVVRIRLTDNFQVYSRFNNVFNNEYFGIDATGTSDDLIFNPQSKFWFLMGVNYQL
ncbi:MAG: TonB-dependent receptor, partial [Saprospiraceae bacterium]|nr:TonB-dependent receptor [Saprospiraceae bacterium]